MPPDELEHEIADGVVCWVAEEDGRVAGVMGETSVVLANGRWTR